MLNPSSIEKTNVQLANICFHESTINGLRYYANNGYPYFQGTAAFLQIIHDWFSIINVKSLYAGQKSREKFREPIYQQDRNFQLDYLKTFNKWLEIWEASNTKGLSKQTFQAAKVTTLNIIHHKLFA